VGAAMITSTSVAIITSVMPHERLGQAMGIIVAAPTAGSCGALPGAVFGMAHSMNLSEEEIVKAMHF